MQTIYKDITQIIRDNKLCLLMIFIFCAGTRCSKEGRDAYIEEIKRLLLTHVSISMHLKQQYVKNLITARILSRARSSDKEYANYRLCMLPVIWLPYQQSSMKA
jgi:hypothetical protein